MFTPLIVSSTVLISKSSGFAVFSSLSPKTAWYVSYPHFVRGLLDPLMGREYRDG